MKTNEHYVFFWGDDDIYSNFHPATFTIYGKTFPSSEHAFMYAKAMYFHADDVAEKVLTAKRPYDAKQLGRSIKNYDEAAWNTVREEIMEEVVFEKFRQNAHLTVQILMTEKRTLVEASPYDKIWGIGLGENDPKILDPLHWKGLNLLGNVLMRVRARLAPRHPM